MLGKKGFHELRQILKVFVSGVLLMEIIIFYFIRNPFSLKRKPKILRGKKNKVEMKTGKD